MDKCEYQSCEDDAIRHFAAHYFCNEHNWYLRKRVQVDRPKALREWVETFI